MCDPKPFYELIVKEKIEFLAEREGFEPTNAGSKSRCLTEMRMKNVGIAWFIFLEL